MISFVVLLVQFFTPDVNELRMHLLVFDKAAIVTGYFWHVSVYISLSGVLFQSAST
jgi:hypothetical protein